MLKTTRKATPSPKASSPRMSLQETMRALKKAGSAQTRKTYARHGAPEPMFGVKFGTLQLLWKRIRVDQDLAEALWKTGNFDARNLAVKVADPATISSRELDRWAGTPTAWMCGGYIGTLTAEGPFGPAKAEKWISATDQPTRFTGWALVAALALVDESLPDGWFTKRLKRIENSIAAATNQQRYAMNSAVIAIGCRNVALRHLATAAARRIGTVDVDHGDTACKTPVAVESIDKAWARSASMGFVSPAALDRARGSMRTRC